MYSDSPEAFGVQSLVSLGAFADQATTSLFLLGELQEQRDDNAYVTAFASTVQDSLRTVLPDVPGLELVGGSVPSAPHAAVGGDWYDALRLPDGSVGLIIGDVMGHDYREGVSIWFRGIFRFSPHPDLMAEAPLGFQLHGLVAMGLFALWPFTRLVHVFSAPLGYLTRPYIVYRSREDVQLGSHTPRRGWQRVDR